MTIAVSPARAAARIVAEGLKIGVNLGKHVPCEVRDAECDKDASWRWQHCCARPRNICQAHHEELLAKLAKKGFYTRPWTCTDCGTRPMPNPTYHPI